MRKIGEVENRTDANVFGNYLVSLGIRNQVEENAQKTWSVWIESDEHLEKAEEELARFLSDPSAPEYAVKARKGKAFLQKEKKENARARSRIIDARTNFSGGMPPGIGYVTVVLIGFSLVVFFLRHSGGDLAAGVMRMLMIADSWRDPAGPYVWRPGLYDIRHGQIWRLITPIFIHYGILHLVFNMWWLVDFGSAVEYLEGSWNLLAQVLVYAILGNLGQYYMSGPFFGGMSGVVYGLFGHIWICSKHDPTRPYALRKSSTILIIAWYFACLFGWVGTIANTAHTAGLVAGIVWATITVRQIPFTRIRF